MIRHIDANGFKHAGVRPVLGPALTGLAGLLGGLFVAWLGVLAALGIMGPFELDDPWNLFGNAIRVLIPMMMVAAGAVAGFLVGTVILPTLLMLVLAWEEVGRTVGYLLLLLLFVTPLTLWLLLQVDSSGTPGSAGTALWVGAASVGGLTPAAARWIAIRYRRGPSPHRGK